MTSVQTHLYCYSTAISYNISSSGTFSVSIPARSAIALHTGAKGTSNMVSVLFEETATTTFGEVMDHHKTPLPHLTDNNIPPIPCR